MEELNSSTDGGATSLPEAKVEAVVEVVVVRPGGQGGHWGGAARSTLFVSGTTDTSLLEAKVEAVVEVVVVQPRGGGGR